MHHEAASLGARSTARSGYIAILNSMHADATFDQVDPCLFSLN